MPEAGNPCGAAAPVQVRRGPSMLFPPAWALFSNLCCPAWAVATVGERAGHLGEERREGDVREPPVSLPLGVIL